MSDAWNLSETAAYPATERIKHHRRDEPGPAHPRGGRNTESRENQPPRAQVSLYRVSESVTRGRIPEGLRI